MVGRPLSQRERIWRDLRVAAAGQPGGTTWPLWAPFDVALWDLWAKLQGLPLYRAIGGFRTELPLCLEGSAGIDPQTAANEAKKAEADGYRAYALAGTTSVIDVGVPRAQTDAALAAIGAAREAVAPGFPLLYAGAGPGPYKHLDALTIGRALDAADYTSFEDPLPAGDALALGQLAAELDTPVLATVAGVDAGRLAAQHLAGQTADLVRVAIPAAGGVTDVLKIARTAEAFGVNCEIDDGHGGAVAAHLVGALRNAMFLRWDASDNGATRRSAEGLSSPTRCSRATAR